MDQSENACQVLSHISNEPREFIHSRPQKHEEAIMKLIVD